MSHFTDNLYLRREIQRLLNENFQLKQLLVEYDPNARSPEQREEDMKVELEKRATEAEARAAAARQKAQEQEALAKNSERPDEEGIGYKSAKEAGRAIVADEIKKQQKNFDPTFKGNKDLEDAFKESGFTEDQVRNMDASNYSRFLRQLRSAVGKKAETAAAGDVNARAAQIQADIESGKYALTDFQQKLWKGDNKSNIKARGTKYIQQLAKGLAKREAESAGREARQTAYRGTRAARSYNLDSIGDAESIVRRRDMAGELSDTGEEEQFVRFREKEAADIKAFRERQAAAAAAQRERQGAFGQSMSDDELLSMASQRGMSAIPGGQRRAYDELLRRQQQRISQGVQTSQARERLAQKQREAPAQLQSAIEREKSAIEKLKAMEAAAKARREQSATKAIEDILGRFQ